MALANYISDLLYRYECVVVPELGAFLTQKHTATINVSTNVFLPPRKTVSFNEQLKQNDGLLANHIALTEAIDYSQALENISIYVSQIKGKLIAGESVLLQEIGDFSLSYEGKLQFSPLEGPNYLTSAFGFDNMHKAPVLREVYKEEVAVLEDKAPIAFIPETRTKHSYLKYAAVAVVTLGLFGVIGRQMYTNQMNEVVAHNELETLEIEKAAYQKASFFDITPIEVPRVTFNVAVEKEVVGRYHIVAGAFSFEENADKKIEQLKEQGFSPRKIGQNKYGLHQVVYASVVGKAEALSTLRTIKKSHNSHAWLLVKDIN
jgi:hypothetical protein